MNRDYINLYSKEFSMESRRYLKEFSMEKLLKYSFLPIFCTIYIILNFTPIYRRLCLRFLSIFLFSEIIR